MDGEGLERILGSRIGVGHQVNDGIRRAVAAVLISC
jgi:hypothetical protein